MMPLRHKTFTRARRPAPRFRLFQKTTGREEAVRESLKQRDERPDIGRVRCPLCEWRPRASSRWCCDDCGHPEYFYGGCGTAWNTFETRGLCPGCGHRWRWTACLACAGWSPHEEWYAAEES